MTAIGVAIDEGIGQDIQEAYVALGGHFSAMVETETHAWLNNYCQQSDNQDPVLCNTNQVLNLTIYRYGFMTTSGEDDLVTPKLDIGFVIEGNAVEPKRPAGRRSGCPARNGRSRVS